MKDPRAVIREQIADAEGTIEECRAKLAEAETALPILRDALAQLDKKLGKPDGDAEASAERQESAEHEPPDDSGEKPKVDRGEEPKVLRRQKEIQRVLDEVIPTLPPKYSPPDVSEALEKHGFYVNRSTLRTNLQFYAQRGKARLVDAGKGRRAAVYERTGLTTAELLKVD